MKQYLVPLTLLLVITTVVSQSYYQNGQEVLLTPLIQSATASTVPQIRTAPPQSSDSIQWYTDQKGELVGITPQILIVWKNINQKESILTTLSFLSQKQLSPTITLLTFPTATNIFDLSKQLYHLPEITSAQPNTLRTKRLR